LRRTQDLQDNVDPGSDYSTRERHPLAESRKHTKPLTCSVTRI